MRLVFFGPPGAGKGTIAGRLAADRGLPHVSTGELFRSAIRNRTPLGIRIKDMMDSGSLVPDEITIDTVKERLKEGDVNQGYVLDGFPRTVAQADALSELTSLDLVLNLFVGDEAIVARLSGRRVCTSCGNSHHIRFLPPKKDGVCDRCNEALIQREDDTEIAIRKRLEVYKAQTAPLIRYYRSRGLISDVDGSPPPDDVYAAVLGVLESLSGNSETSSNT
jgi:adenylate kinase